MFLNGIMQSSLALDILSIHLRTVSQQELAQLDTLNTVYETSSAVKIRFLYIRIIVDEELDNVQMSHEAGGPHGGRPGVRHAVHVRPVPHQHVHHAELARYGGAPQRSYVVNRPEIFLSFRY